MLDKNMAEHAKIFKPHVNVPALDTYKVSGNLNLPKTTAITIMNYIDSDDKDQDFDCPIAKELEAI